MNAKKLFVYLWVLVVLAGIPAGEMMISAFPITTMEAVERSRKLLAALLSLPLFVIERGPVTSEEFMYVRYLNPRALYAIFIFSALAWSLYRWVKNPQSWTMLWSLFCGWMLCSQLRGALLAFFFFLLV